MNDEIYITDADYNFFKGLSNSDKILSLFDVWVSDIEEYESYDEMIESIIESSIKNTDMANVVITNDLAIINGDTYNLVKTAAGILFEQGFVLERRMLTDAGNDVFRKQKYCNVYSIVGMTNPIIQN